mgnify:FL=1
MYYLAFDPSSKKLIYAGKDNTVNVGFGTDGVVVWTTLDEEFDPTYNYTYDSSTLVASKGDLIVLDASEEQRKEAEWKAVQYRDARRSQYPDIGDQLDDLYKQGAFSDEMAAKIKAVKDNNPKSS